MPQPYNYLSQIQRPDYANSLWQGYQIGQSMKANNEARALREQQIQAQAAFKADFQNAIDTKDASKIDALFMQYPERSAQIKPIKDMFSNINRESAKGIMIRAKIASMNGNPAVAESIFRDAAEAMRQNDPVKAETFSSLADSIKNKPENAGKLIDFAGSISLGKDYFDPLTKLAEEGKIKAETEGEVADVAEKTSDTARKDQEAGLKKLVLPTQLEAEQKDFAAAREKGITDKFTLDSAFELMGEKNSSGLWQITKEKLKSIAGEGDIQTVLQQLISKMSMSEALSAKAAGSLSEGEMKELLKAVPSASDSNFVIEKWMNRVNRLNNWRIAAADIGANWVMENRSTGPAQKDFNIGKLKVKKGETRGQFLDRIGPMVYGENAKKGTLERFNIPKVDFVAEKTQETSETQTDPLTVIAPNGKPYQFRSQAEADKFKAKFGIK